MLAVGVLVLFTVARQFGLLGPLPVAVGLLTAALILVAWTGGLTRDDLGLGWRDVPAGLGYGAAAAGLVLLNKVDLLPHLSFDVGRFVAHLRTVNPRARVLEVSATRGDGLSEWYRWLEARGHSAPCMT